MEKTPIKILSWNIWEQCHFDLAKYFLRASNADIIGLQEVLLDDPLRDTTSFLKSLGYDYAVAPAAEFVDKGRTIKMNNVLFSKYPILEHNAHILVEGCMGSAVQAKIDIKGQVLNVFCTHLKHTHQKPSNFQSAQLENLIRLLARNSTIVMGDFNALPESGVIKKMKENFVDTDPKSNPTWGLYPEGCATCKPEKIDTRLDYIFISPDLKLESFKVEESKASDHLPISVTIKV